MAGVISNDPFVALLIGFAYLLTKIQYVHKDSVNQLSFESFPKFVKDMPQVETNEPDDGMLNKKADTAFTSEFQFNDAQSNVVNDVCFEDGNSYLGRWIWSSRRNDGMNS